MNNAQLINQSSGSVEFYTPSNIIEAARLTMGGIDLDPASSEQANKTVKADRFYSEQADGLYQIWLCNSVWLNHPFGRGVNKLWIDKLIDGFTRKHFHEACCITYACTSEKWFQPLFNYPMCFLSPRTNYYLPDGSMLKGVTKGSVVTYLGPRSDRFAYNFSELGQVMSAMR